MALKRKIYLEDLPKRGSKEFWKRGIKKLGKDVKQTASVLEHFTPSTSLGGLTIKILKKGLPKLAKKGWK